jgi:hypothetical protein
VCQCFGSTASPTSNGRDIRSKHLVPLAIGGAPEDLRNVWPEPKVEAKEKDEVEDALLSAACYRHTLTLQAAQAAIAQLDPDTRRDAGGSRAPLRRKRRMMSYWAWDHDDDEGYDGHDEDEHEALAELGRLPTATRG